MNASSQPLVRPTICQVVHSLEIGGAELLVTELSRAFQERFRFVVACLDRAGPLAEQLRNEGHVVEVLNRRPGIDWRCGWRLARFLREQHVTAVHAHQYTPFFYSLIARGMRGAPPIIFTEHGRQHPDYPRRKRILCNRLLLRADDRIIAVGEAVRSALIANEGLPASRIKVLFNGVRLEPFQAAASDSRTRAEVRRELGLSERDFAIIQVARLNELKDHVTAAKAIAQVAPHVPNLRWLVVGDGEQRGPLETLVRETGLESATRWLGVRNDVPRLLAAANVCLLSSISEGIPLTLIEAMAARLPVVATDVGGVAEIVVPEITGLLASAGDSSQLAQHLVRLATDRPLAARLGRNGAARAADLFPFDRMVQGYERIFAAAAGQTDRTSAAQVEPVCGPQATIQRLQPTPNLPTAFAGGEKT